MQGHLHHQHQQQQQLVALLSAALPSSLREGSPSSAAPSPSPSSVTEAERTGGGDSERVAALNSLNRAIIYPPNSLLVVHSAPFLYQGLSQLISDKSYPVRKAAAVAYGALCSVTCSATFAASNGRQGPVISAGLADGFIGWALPLARNFGVADGTVELALAGLSEFLSVGDAQSKERYIQPILKSCQELLEDERTSLSLLGQLLGLLCLISFRYGSCFQPHFVDIVDLLLGWALMTDLSESGRSIIMKTFLQFKNHWINNFQFSFGLLSKFLGDMEVLIQDAGIDSDQQFGRLIVLFSCFLTVLQAATCNMLENLNEQMFEALERIVPQLLGCISSVGKKFGWNRWFGESWRCVVLLAEIMHERFSVYYPIAVDILFQGLKVLPAYHIPRALKSNIQLLVLQKPGLTVTSVKNLLQFDLPLSRLRLHPNHLVVGNIAPTYLFLLQNACEQVVSQAVSSLLEELEILKNMIKKKLCSGIHNREVLAGCADIDQLSSCSRYDDRAAASQIDSCSRHAEIFSITELVSLIKFDLQVLLAGVSRGHHGEVHDIDVAMSKHKRCMLLMTFISEKLDPFTFPIGDFLDLQLFMVRTLHKLCEAESHSKSVIATRCHDTSYNDSNNRTNKKLTYEKAHADGVIECMNRYRTCIVKCLCSTSALAVKGAALDWIGSLCRLGTGRDHIAFYIDEPCEHTNMSNDVLFALLDAASDKESVVRSGVARVLEILLQTKVVYPGNFYLISEVAFERLGDPDTAIKNAYTRIVSIVLPATLITYGICGDQTSFHRSQLVRLGNLCYLNWKNILALKKFPRQIQPQQLVFILSYLSQRWKSPLSSWIQRLVFSCSIVKDIISISHEDAKDVDRCPLWMDNAKVENFLDNICSVNSLAAGWWSLHEAARSAVTFRLRTNLGGPTQTFAALERMLLDIARVLLVESDQTDLSSSDLHLLPMRLLLDFVESLKKHVYNAYEGSSVLPSATRQSSLFFRANKKVCEEWFSRICEPMLNAGVALQCHHATFYYCTLRLQELQNLTASFKEKMHTPGADTHNFRVKLTSDILKVLRHTSLALCRNNEPEALIGLRNWADLTFAPLFADESTLACFSWISGLVLQAQGQYEKAAAHFSLLLQSENVLGSMDSEGIQFVIARTIESFSAVSDWKSLEIWLSELQTLRAKHAGKSYAGALTTAGNEINAIHALARYDDGDNQTALLYLDLTPKSSIELTLDPMMALERSEQMLLRAMLRKSGESDEAVKDIFKGKLMLDEVLSVAPLDGLSEAAPYAAQLHCLLALEESLKVKDPAQVIEHSTNISLVDQVFDFPINKFHQDSSLWLKIFRVYRTIQPSSQITLSLCQKLIVLARKQCNFFLARRMCGYLRDSLFHEGTFSEFLSVSLQYETILLNYAEGKREQALTEIWSMIQNFLLYPTTTGFECCKQLKAKACLKLSSWLKRENSYTTLNNVINKILVDLGESDTFCTSSTITQLLQSKIKTDDTNYWSFIEEIIGTSIKLSHSLCPTLGKAWLSYASWCYTQAICSLSADSSCTSFLRSCSFSTVLVPEFSQDRFHLTKEEVTNIETIISNFLLGERNALLRTEEVDKLCLQSNEGLIKSAVQRAVYIVESSAAAPGAENCSREVPYAVMAAELQMLFIELNGEAPKDHLVSCVSHVTDVWWALRKRRVSLFGNAVHGYFQYLIYSSSKIQEDPSAKPYSDSVKGKAGSCTIKATLYILHIILNYGVELKETIEPALASVPLLPWQEVTPQLFARLTSHSQREVRSQLQGILMMLGKLSPGSIIYPTLVDINNVDGEPLEELQHLLGCLEKLYPQLVNDVKLVIKELGNMTVLWEEQWLSTLQDLHSDVVRRIHMLKEEAKRIADNTTLTQNEKNKINAAKYSAVMAPVIVALERRLASTSRDPETPHEEWFQKEYSDQLRNAIVTFKNPPVSPLAVGDAWRPFDTIAASLVSYQRKSLIQLKEVAPQLALLSASQVPMPGLEKKLSLLDSMGDLSSSLHGLVTVSSFLENVTILSTKTRPKKIVILGSDGQKYTYLLKGREDLRLDARIMQLLQAVNSFFYANADTYGRDLAIRYYSVTPISGRAGIIQWVDNVISIYAVFKMWQKRNQLAQMSSNGNSNTNNKMAVAIPRPSDMFYGKIIPALKEKGIKRVISRRDWPHEVKRKVLMDLMREVPRQLLHQEIWCASEGFKAFASKSKRFSSSVAAMSMVGHVLGLGDRHLDNVLIDFHSGDVVHIDYNICFDKGKRLKIPEIVPFRLTQTIETALGLTGTEGTFKSNCEYVVDVLRKNKDVILMMLDVFVWDPLVEWTRGDMHDEAAIGGEEKKGMELAVSLSLFASRFQEIRVPLQEHHDLLLATLPAALSALEILYNVLSQYEVVSAVFYHVDKERTNLVHHETSAKSAFSEAMSIAEKLRTSYEAQSREYTQAKAIAAEKGQDAAKWIEHRGRVLNALRNDSLPEIKAFIRLSAMEEALSLTSAVVVAGVPLTVVPEPTQVQCYDLDSEVSGLMAELDGGITGAIEVLQEYALALQRILPLNYIATSPVNGWAQLLLLSVNNLSSEVFSLSRRQAAELIKKAQRDDDDSAHKRYTELFLNRESYVTEIKKLTVERSEIIDSVGSDTEIKCKDRLLSAFSEVIQSKCYSRKKDEESLFHIQGKSDDKKDQVCGDFDERETQGMLVIYAAVAAVLQEAKNKVLEISSNNFDRNGWRLGHDVLHPESGILFHQFEEQIEKCVLVTALTNELHQLVGFKPSNEPVGRKEKLTSLDWNWASVFQASVSSCKTLLEHLTQNVLPNLIKAAITHQPHVLEAFGSLSQIRGLTDTALEQLAEVELERVALLELEKNYFVKVEFISKQQAALEEAATRSRDHLSWEEAEELASQEEECKEQLERLHQMWNQKDMHSSSLTKKESDILISLFSSEHQLVSLSNIDKKGDQNVNSSEVLLAMLFHPFTELESVDKVFSSYTTVTSQSEESSLDLIPSNYAPVESIWKYTGLLKNHCFFIWKVGIVDSFLDSCLHDISSTIDHSLGFDQLHVILKRKLEVQLQEQIGEYIMGRVIPVFLQCLECEIVHVRHLNEVSSSSLIAFYQDKKGPRAVAKIKDLLEDYCVAHDAARAAKSAVSVLERQVTELTEALCKTILEIVQMEWLCGGALPYIGRRSVSKDIIDDDRIHPSIVGLDRSKLLTKLESSITSIAHAVECLKACEKNSVSVEAQLERAMGWACGGSSTSSGSNTIAKNSGIPSEFHDHLQRRRQLLWASQEQACSIMRICNMVMEFEASRDGIFQMPGEVTSGCISTDGRMWQQGYLNILTRLDVSYHSFICAERDWQLAQTRMEAAASVLYSATNELLITSAKAQSAADDLQEILTTMRNCAHEASVALSDFCCVSKEQTALTSECGSMLEEVLAISEGLHDISNLGKEASAVHSRLMDDLSKVTMIVYPLECSLSSDIATIADVVAVEKESNMNVLSAHGQALYKSYAGRLKESCQQLRVLVPSVTRSVEELHSMLIKLARSASLHAGNLHKALEGLGESQIMRSEALELSRSELTNVSGVYDNVEETIISGSQEVAIGKLADPNQFSVSEEGWISPPATIYDSSTDSSFLSTELTSSDGEGLHNINLLESADSYTDNRQSLPVENKINDITVSGAPNSPENFVTSTSSDGNLLLEVDMLDLKKGSCKSTLPANHESAVRLCQDDGQGCQAPLCNDYLSQTTRGKNDQDAYPGYEQILVRFSYHNMYSWTV